MPLGTDRLNGGGCGGFGHSKRAENDLGEGSDRDGLVGQYLCG